MQFCGGVPSRAIKSEKGVNVLIEVSGEILEVGFHYLDVDPRKKTGVRIPGGWTYCPENVDPLVFGLPECPGTTAALCPYSRQSALLAEAGLVLKPQDYFLF